MQIKKFEARNMTEALMCVKNEFGTEAVILSARTVRERGNRIWGLARSARVEITAAVDRSTASSGGTAATRRTFGDTFEKTDPAGGGTQVNSYAGTRANGITRLQRIAGGLAAAASPPAETPANLNVLQRCLLDQGIDADIALEIIRIVRKKAGVAGNRDLTSLQPFVLEALKAMGAGIGRIRPGAGKCRIVALMGASGVGKTTMAAALAASWLIRGNRHTALINMDSERIGSGRLGVYARIMGIPMKTACDADSLGRAIDHLGPKELILIDTPGIGLKDENRLRRLEAVLGCGPSIEPYLLFSAATREKDMAALCRLFQNTKPRGLMFTKLDETRYFGDIINQLVRSGIPAVCFSDGRNFPENVREATLSQVLEMVLASVDDDHDGRNGTIRKIG